jgi:hypothetical protein
MEYKIIEESDNVNTIVIEKSGLTATFTLQDIENHIAYLNKTKREIEGKITIDSAGCTNIENNNEWIKEMTDEEIHACYLYFQSKATVIKGNEKLEEIESALKEYADEKVIINEKLCLDQRKPVEVETPSSQEPGVGTSYETEPVVTESVPSEISTPTETQSS